MAWGKVNASCIKIWQPYLHCVQCVWKTQHFYYIWRMWYFWAQFTYVLKISFVTLVDSSDVAVQYHYRQVQMSHKIFVFCVQKYFLLRKLRCRTVYRTVSYHSVLYYVRIPSNIWPTHASQRFRYFQLDKKNVTFTNLVFHFLPWKLSCPFYH